MEAYGPRNSDTRTWHILETVRGVAEARGVSMSQVSLAWLARRPAVTSVILGAPTLDQLEDSLGAAGLPLAGRETALLDEASTPVTGEFPSGPQGVAQRD